MTADIVNIRSITTTIKADCSALHAAFRQLEIDLDRLEPLPDFIHELLRGLVAHLPEEITIDGDPVVSPAGEFVVRLGFRSGGRFEFCASALRAFRPDIA